MTSCLHPLCDPEHTTPRWGRCSGCDTRLVSTNDKLIVVSVVIAEGERPVPSRTRKLSPPAPMVLPPPGCGRVGRRRHSTFEVWPRRPAGPHFFYAHFRPRRRAYGGQQPEWRPDARRRVGHDGDGDVSE